MLCRFLCHAIVLTAATSAAAAQTTTALTGGTVIDGTGGQAITNAVVVVTGSRLCGDVQDSLADVAVAQ